MPEIAKCPFCGGKAELTGRQWGDTIEYLVRCKNIDCVACNTHYLGEQDAIAAWNRRAQSDGCEWCKPDGELYILVTYATTNKDLIEHAKQHRLPQFCCQCGKRLGE